jgi:hypothetical protein
MNKGYCLCAAFSLLVVVVFSFSQGAQIENFENEIYQVRDINLGSETAGTNIFSASLLNRSDSTKNLVIDIRTEGVGFGSPWQSWFFFQLKSHEYRRIKLEYEIATPFAGRIILRLGESEKYFDKEKWRSLGEAERAKNPYPEVKFFWKKEIYKKLDMEHEKAISDLISAYDICLEPLSPEKIFQIRAELPGRIKKAREEENPLRRKLSQLFKIDRECLQDFDFREETWGEKFSYLNSNFDAKEIKAEVFSIAGDAGNRITAFFATLKKDSQEKKPLIILLSGNPPGTKESLTSASMSLALLGYHTIGIDRRLSSRRLDKKEKFLTNYSDPVFDTLRLIDFLQSQSRFKISRIGIYGFSAGAAEAKFVAALDHRIDAAVLACCITSHNWLFKDKAGWFPIYSGMIIFPELGLGNPDIGNVTSEQFWENFNKVKPEHNPKAREIFNEIFPYFEDLDPLRVVPLIAPIPLLIVTGARDDQFPTPGVAEVDMAVEKEYQKYGLQSCSELYFQPRSGHTISLKGNYIIYSFFKRWLN